jgi:hypothetical protein
MRSYLDRVLEEKLAAMLQDNQDFKSYQVSSSSSSASSSSRPSSSSAPGLVSSLRARHSASSPAQPQPKPTASSSRAPTAPPSRSQPVSANDMYDDDDADGYDGDGDAAMFGGASSSSSLAVGGGGESGGGVPVSSRVSSPVAATMISRAAKSGGFVSWLRPRNFHEMRNRRECMALAAALDAMVADGVDPSRDYVEIIARRLSGVVLADKKNNWDLCDASEWLYEFDSLIDETQQAQVFSSAQSIARIRARGGGARRRGGGGGGARGSYGNYRGGGGNRGGGNRGGGSFNRGNLNFNQNQNQKSGVGPKAGAGSS